MSHLKNQEILEFWFELGLENGLSEEEAIEFADKKFEIGL